MEAKPWYAEGKKKLRGTNNSPPNAKKKEKNAQAVVGDGGGSQANEQPGGAGRRRQPPRRHRAGGSAAAAPRRSSHGSLLFSFCPSWAFPPIRHRPAAPLGQRLPCLLPPGLQRRAPRARSRGWAGAEPAAVLQCEPPWPSEVLHVLFFFFPPYFLPFFFFSRADFPAARFGWRRGGFGASQAFVLCGELHLVLHCRPRLEVKSILASWKWPKEATCRSKTAVPDGRIHGLLQLGEVLKRVPGAAYVQTRARNCWGSRRCTASPPCRPSELCRSSALLEIVFINNCFCLHCRNFLVPGVCVHFSRVNIVSGGGLDVLHPLATPQFHGKKAQFRSWKGARRHIAAFACPGVYNVAIK
ncbi:uncharacterized protein LOC128917141 [Rissa tridactyla]|uniref:uncharacterized protein LOC128917141 n=1 Tax=Rissa tridactyla TaxID=75485 RepID=UPI0023BA66AE|nr:uncharacterized protein LOC128917141 [Rissa tridactyla]